MRLFLGKRRGAVNVFLTLILVPVIIVSSLFVDASRGRLAGSLVSSAGDLTLNTVLTQYDSVLNDYYGMLASCQDIDSFLSTADDYFMACLKSQDVEVSEARAMTDDIMGLINGSGGTIVDLLQLSELENKNFEVKALENGTLKNPRLIKKEIVEFMKYRAPVDMIGDLLDRFKTSASSLEKAKDDGELTEKKQDAYTAQGDLIGRAMEVYDKLMEYKALGITKETVNETKTFVQGLREKYKGFHVKMIKDLYNTQGVDFKEGNIEWNPDISSVNVESRHVNSYINNLARAMMDFISADKRLNIAADTILPERNGDVYDIQYYVYCVKILEQDSIYANYVSKANTMSKCMAELEKAFSGLTDEEKAESYDLAACEGVSTQGEQSRQSHYDLLKAQYTDLKDSSGGNYSQITETLSGIKSHILGRTDTQGIDDEIWKTYQKLQNYYTDYDQAMSLIGDAVTLLNGNEGLKKLAETYRNDHQAWKDKANSYDSSISKSDRDEADNDENREILQNVTPERIDELVQRLNNIKSLLGSLKDAVDGFKYNNHKIKDIDGYNAFRSASAVRENRIKMYNEELSAYTEDEGVFRFTSSVDLDKINITDNNNPAIHQVNTPELYKWLVKYFRNYEKEKGEADSNKSDAESKKEEAQKIGSDIDKNYGNESSKKEIKDIESPPSASYQEDKSQSGGKSPDDGVMSNDIGNVSGFVSDLFSDIGGMLGQAAVNLRDELYTIDYVMKMFSYDTFENEGKYELCGGNVTLDTPYDAATEEKWKSTKVTDTFNKSLTNKMINAAGNYSYGNEVEYILYGKDNKSNKSSSYGTIFAIRYVLNLPAEFSANWNGNPVLNTLAASVQAASYGVIPAPLIKLIVILGLTAMESARDLKYLQKGMPVELVKGKDDLDIKYPDLTPDSAITGRKEKTATSFFYSDYLSLILFLKLLAGDEYAVYVRIGDVIQANMIQIGAPGSGKDEGGSEFNLGNSIVYYSATAELKVEPLLLRLPIVENAGYGAPEDGGWNSISYKAVRGY